MSRLLFHPKKKKKKKAFYARCFFCIFLTTKHFSPITYSFIIRGFNSKHIQNIFGMGLSVQYARVPNKCSIVLVTARVELHCVIHFDKKLNFIFQIMSIMFFRKQPDTL